MLFKYKDGYLRWDDKDNEKDASTKFGELMGNISKNLNSFET